MNKLSYDELLDIGYKPFNDNSTINGVIVYKRMNHECTFMFGFDNNKKQICEMCLNDNQIKEMIGSGI